MILIDRFDFNFISMVTVNKHVFINVNKLDLEEVSGTCNEISKVNCCDAGVRVD